MDVEHSRAASASLLNMNSSAILSASFLLLLGWISQANVAMSSKSPLNRFPEAIKDRNSPKAKLALKTGGVQNLRILRRTGIAEAGIPSRVAVNGAKNRRRPPDRLEPGSQLTARNALRVHVCRCTIQPPQVSIHRIGFHRVSFCERYLANLSLLL